MRPSEVSKNCTLGVSQGTAPKDVLRAQEKGASQSVQDRRAYAEFLSIAKGRDLN